VMLRYVLLASGSVTLASGALQIDLLLLLLLCCSNASLSALRLALLTTLIALNCFACLCGFRVWFGGMGWSTRIQMGMGIRIRIHGNGNEIWPLGLEVLIVFAHTSNKHTFCKIECRGAGVVLWSKVQKVCITFHLMPLLPHHLLL